MIKWQRTADMMHDELCSVSIIRQENSRAIHMITTDPEPRTGSILLEEDSPGSLGAPRDAFGVMLREDAA